MNYFACGGSKYKKGQYTVTASTLTFYAKDGSTLGGMYYIEIDTPFKVKSMSVKSNALIGGLRYLAELFSSDIYVSSSNYFRAIWGHSTAIDSRPIRIDGVSAYITDTKVRIPIFSSSAVSGQVFDYEIFGE